MAVTALARRSASRTVCSVRRFAASASLGLCPDAGSAADSMPRAGSRSCRG
ncbi:hypothetical protein NKH18_18595 [Streptomyces sp. M10(2022)]